MSRYATGFEGFDPENNSVHASKQHHNDEHDRTNRQLFEAIDDLVVGILTEGDSLLKRFELRRFYVNPIVEAIEEMVDGSFH